MPSVRKSSSGKYVVHRQKGSQVVEESQHRLCSRVTVGALPDGVLLEIFDFYLVICYQDYHEEAWHTLVHVCKTWRSIVFALPRRLRLQLICTNKRPMKSMLDLWPALPIVIQGNRGMSRPQVANNIIAALMQHNRVCKIYIVNIPNILLKKIWTMKMKDPFPALTSLRLYRSSKNINAPPLPDSFLGGSAPRWHSILWDIPPSGYISPEAMITVLPALTNLRHLVLRFRCPRSRADREKRHLPRQTCIVLPALTSFWFKGNSEYLEDIVGQIDTPLLDLFDLTFFNQLIFDTPRLCDFIRRTESFNAPHRVSIVFTDYSVDIHIYGQGENIRLHITKLAISCRPLDWQLSSLSQVLTSALSHLTFERLEIDNFGEHRKNDAENAEWLEVLHPFTSVKDLVLRWRWIPLFPPALEDLAGGKVTEVLPALQNIFLKSEQPSEPVKKAIGKFTSARRLSGRPVTVHHRKRRHQDYMLWEVGDQ